MVRLEYWSAPKCNPMTPEISGGSFESAIEGVLCSLRGGRTGEQSRDEPVWGTLRCSTAQITSWWEK